MLNPAVLMILFRSVPVFQAAWQRWRFRCGDQVFAALHNLLHGMSLLVADIVAKVQNCPVIIFSP